jgi:hypothetical protein
MMYRRRCAPPGLQHLRHFVRTGRDADKFVGAVLVGNLRRFVGVESAVLVEVEVDCPAGEVGLAGVLNAVTVAVVELLAADLDEVTLDGADVDDRAAVVIAVGGTRGATLIQRGRRGHAVGDAGVDGRAVEERLVRLGRSTIVG